MKRIFISEPILVILDLDKEMQVEVDVSDYAMEEVLLVKCEDGR